MYNWTKVEDALPEDEESEYLFCISGIDDNIAYENATVEGYYEDGKFYPKGCNMPGVEVIAWMPLPIYEEEPKKIQNIYSLCALCGKPSECTHHLIFGSDRAKADADKLVMELCDICHTKGRLTERIHDNVAAERLSKICGQLMWELEYVSKNTLSGYTVKENARIKFMQRYGRSYI